MTTQREINWAAPVIGKLEAGKTYVDRQGDKHVVEPTGGPQYAFASGTNIFTGTGAYYVEKNGRHVLDLIAEYTPPAPLKMWMNVYATGSLQLFSSKRNASDAKDDWGTSTRIAVPVTITEGHGP